MDTTRGMPIDDRSEEMSLTSDSGGGEYRYTGTPASTRCSKATIEDCFPPETGSYDPLRKFDDAGSVRAKGAGTLMELGGLGRWNGDL